MFGNFKDAGLVFLNVPFAIVGGILLRYMITGTNFSISAGYWIYRLFGICILDGIILITVFKENLRKFRKASQVCFILPSDLVLMPGYGP